MLREYLDAVRRRVIPLAGLAFLLGSPIALANGERKSESALKSFYESSWERQPDYKSYQYRVEAALAKQKIASSLLVSPASVEVAQKTDRANSNQGASETILGLGIPLWLWNERSSSINLADAEYKKLLSQYYLSQLRIAAEVRDAYWNYQKSKIESELALRRHENAKNLALDVERRFKAGDLSRADLHQANGALASSEAFLVEAQANVINAEQRVRSLLGSEYLKKIQFGDITKNIEPLPKVPENLSGLDSSLPIVAALVDQLEVAKKAVDLAKSQTRASPQLQILTTKGREVYGVPYQQSVTVGLKIPFGSEARNTNRLASATAEMVDSEVRLSYERESALSNVESNAALVKSAKMKLGAADKRSNLANETRQFFDKSFRFGETDLPTRLRIELEAVDANRQAAIAKINYAVSVSNLRQALGLLPE
ncbi:MAG: TolC family protein [Polynucleobacter sp.]|uniref:TolC family protein n=1 Tax=Polynucleobacter sp. TaxID=2029855 RepID=UPI0027278888|nr:TolC family protein [Polynucleobacter sp.]MDO8713941.1 TolC family protein [Polynucleobacter sp.]